MIKFIKNNKRTLILFTFFTIGIFIFNFFRPVDMDLMWNYGFSKNISDGLIMYKDFNMVITPLYPAITGLLMKVLSDNLIVFYLINALYALFTLIIVYKLDKRIIFPFFIYFIFDTAPSYNTLSVFYIFLLIYLEKHNKSDYLIGLIISLAFLTKSSIGIFLALPTLYYIKKPKKILKRILPVIITNLLVIAYFYLNNALFDYINFAFLGLLDFRNGNGNYNIITLLTILIIIYIIREYLKTKNFELLYILVFMIMAYPLFNPSHFLTAIIPLVYYLLKKYRKINNLIIKTAPIFICLPILALVINYITCNPKYDNNLFKYRYLQNEYMSDIEAIKNYFHDDYSNVYFILMNSYLYKLSLNIPINEFDLPLKGNLGYNGEEELIKKIKEIKDGSIIVINNAYYEKTEDGSKNQSSKKIYDYITKNYGSIGQFHKFKIYVKN